MSEFDKRFLLARYPTGGVVVDLQSGNYYRINASAAMVCDAMRSQGNVETRVARELKISLEEATQIVAEVSVGLSGPAVRDPPEGWTHFYPSEGGYVLREGDRSLLEVDGPDDSIRLPSASSRPSVAQLELYVRTLVPRLLFQRGVTVLHSSACMGAERLIAFAGLSGAGKTTTARAFAAAGARLLSEDLLVLLPGAPRPVVLTEAESFIRTWARQVSNRLLSDHPRPIPSTDLLGVLDGQSAQLDRILFLDKSRRAGTRFVSGPLAEPDALVTLMTHDFIGSAEPEAWKRYFKTAVALIGTVETAEASTPAGVGYLASAAADYMSNWAS